MCLVIWIRTGNLPVEHTLSITGRGNDNLWYNRALSKLKHAKVIPIFSGGEPDPSNYRPPFSFFTLQSTLSRNWDNNWDIETLNWDIETLNWIIWTSVQWPVWFSTLLELHNFMLFAGWKVRMRPRIPVSRPRSQFFYYTEDLNT